MIKVYLVWMADGGCSVLDGIYSTEEKAHERRSLIKEFSVEAKKINDAVFNYEDTLQLGSSEEYDRLIDIFIKTNFDKEIEKFGAKLVFSYDMYFYNHFYVEEKEVFA